MISLRDRGGAYRAAAVGVLAALALVISLLESVIPISAIVPLPGIKLGFANIIIIFTLFYAGNAEAIAVSIVRCLLAALLFGSATTLVFSLCGGAMSLLCAILYKRFGCGRMSFIGLSVLCAAAHNTGQTFAACAFLQSGAPFAYLPLLLVASVVTGIITGIILQILSGYFKLL